MFAINEQIKFMTAGGQYTGQQADLDQVLLYSKLIQDPTFGEFASELLPRVETYKEADLAMHFIDDLCDTAVVVSGMILSIPDAAIRLKLIEAYGNYDAYYAAFENVEILAAEGAWYQVKSLLSKPYLGVDYSELFRVLDSIVVIARFIGLDLAGAMKAVNENNLSKCELNDDGSYSVIKNEHGKIIKPESFVPVDLSAFLNDTVSNKIHDLIDSIRHKNLSNETILDGVQANG